MSNTVLILQNGPEVRVGAFEEIPAEQGWTIEVLPLFSGPSLPPSLNDVDLTIVSGGSINRIAGKGVRFFGDPNDFS
ncbi:MAG TPA: hypothetical protein VK564_09395, partial [Thermodesulfobacteriota bacterium]|nr:hypothetical protein [Thermodesulfobacteriota bacterium]